MTALLSASPSQWVKFDRYTVWEGWIRPADGARLESFDPWDGKGASKESAPYESLLNLMQSIELKPRPGPGPLLSFSEDSEARATNWCSEHGLLGILLHRVQMVTLAPRYGAMPNVEGRWIPGQRQYIRVNQDWVARDRWGMRPGAVQEGDADQWQDNLVPAQEIPKDWPKSEVWLQDLTTGQLNTEPLATTWGKFFPTVPDTERETYAYPLPGSPDFWALYAEPIQQFVEAGSLLLRAVHGVELPAEQYHAPEAHRQAKRAIGVLNSLLGPTGPAAVLSTENKIEPRWQSPSLLGAFAMMALRDFSEQRWPRSCANCGKIFVTKAYQGRYCSNRCRYAAQKRRYRDRQKHRTDSDKSGR